MISTLFMLTVRSFRNEDPPRLLELWKKTQQRWVNCSPLSPPSLNQLQMQFLGLPMLDTRSIMIAFDKDTPVGYIHTAFAPSENGYSFDYSTGQICFLCVDPQYSDAVGAAATLIHAGEDYLSGLGARKIFGGSPSPSVPFYTGFYSGGAAVGILQSDATLINAFYEANYRIHRTTTWFHFALLNYTFEPRDYASAITAETLDYGDMEVEISEVPMAKTWYEGCAFVNGIWFDATAYLVQSNRPVARLRTRISYPDTESTLTMYGGTWLASLMELRVHPDFADGGIQQFLLGELVRYLISYNQIVQIDAHAAEDSLLFALLRYQSWSERDSGCLFVKEL